MYNMSWVGSFAGTIHTFSDVLNDHCPAGFNAKCALMACLTDKHHLFSLSHNTNQPTHYSGFILSSARSRDNTSEQYTPPKDRRGYQAKV